LPGISGAPGLTAGSAGAQSPDPLFPSPSKSVPASQPAVVSAMSVSAVSVPAPQSIVSFSPSSPR